MTIPSYRLDTVTVHLIERMEGTRRSYAGRPDEAQAAFARIAREELVQIIDEHDEIMGPSGAGRVLQREVEETFLPRYTRLAQDQTALEDAGYKAWRGGDPIARFVTTVVALLVTLGTVRVVHHPVALVCFAAVALVPFLPELRRWYYRRQYASLLQEVVDDMARIQDRMDAYGPTALLADPPAQAGVASPETAAQPAESTAARRPRDKEPPT